MESINKIDISGAVLSVLNVSDRYELRSKSKELAEMHTHNLENPDDKHTYICSCNDVPMTVVKTPNGNYTVRDAFKKHRLSCSVASGYCRSKILQEDEQNSFVTEMMLEGVNPKKNNNRKKEKHRKTVVTESDYLCKKSFQSIFMEIIASALFQANNENNVIQEVLSKHFFEYAMDSGSTIGEYNHKIQKKGEWLSIDVLLDVKTIQLPLICGESYEEIYFDKHQMTIPSGLLKIKQTFSKICGGPYMVVYANHHYSNSMPKVIALHVVPVFQSARWLLGVESTLERECIAQFESFGAERFYKPMQISNRLLTEHIEKSISPGFSIQSEFADALASYQENAKSSTLVRPDLFFLFKNVVFVVEVAGMMSKKGYLKQLQDKEKFFYSKFQTVKYLRIENTQECEIKLMEAINETF